MITDKPDDETPDDNPYEDLNPEDFDAVLNGDGTSLNETAYTQFSDELESLLARAAGEGTLMISQVIGELVLQTSKIAFGAMLQEGNSSEEEDDDE